MTGTPHAHDPANNLRGIFAMLLSMAAFVGNDALVKLSAGILPMGQVIFLRGLVTVLMCLAILQIKGNMGSVGLAFSPRVLGRGLADVMAALTFLFALRSMPIADAYAILQFTPLAITAGAALFLGARVGWRRWLATVVGLVGVLIIVRPGGATFNASSLLALSSIIFSVIRDLLTRGITFNIPPMAIAFTSPLLLTLISGGFAFFEDWGTPTPRALAYICAAGVLLLCGQIWLITAMRTGEIAVVAPFRYSIILWSILAGFVVWHELPDPQTFIGIAIVFSAGLYTFWREQTLSRAGRI